MKYGILLLATHTLVASVFAQNEFQVTAKKMYYKIVPTGSGPVIPVTGVARFHLEQKVNDSVIFSSFGKGLSVMKMSKLSKADEYYGIFKKLRAGDSVVSLNLANDMLSNKDLVLPDFIHPGDSLYQCFKIIDVFKTEQEFIAFTAKEKNQKLLAEQGEIKKYLAEKKITAQKTKLGCYIRHIKKGTGVMPVKGSKVSVRYTGKLLSGLVFDTNEITSENKPLLDFETGKNAVIAGFDEAAGLLQKGGRCEVFIPSVHAYGESGSGDVIPPNSILIFEVELVQLKAPTVKRK